jgi:hypothetical protein
VDSRIKVAALYVETNGVYYGLPDVDPWDEARDARLYEGPWPVVAHPPCARWSRTAALTEAWFGYKRGDDGGCFAAALDAVRKFGGVLEHPAYSAAWAKFGLARPSYHGWTSSLFDDGWTCYVEQGRYGLPTKKPTWLYAVGVEPADLAWGYTPSDPVDVIDPNGRGGMHAFRNAVSKTASSRTPDAFRDVLLDMARSCAREGLGRETE